MTISFNIRSEYGHSSYIKLGGYDKFALINGKQEDMKLFKTLSINTWLIKLDKITDNEDKLIM